jgi:hypothetical protein
MAHGGTQDLAYRFSLMSATLRTNAQDIAHEENHLELLVAGKATCSVDRRKVPV